MTKRKYVWIPKSKRRPGPGRPKNSERGQAVRTINIGLRLTEVEYQRLLAHCQKIGMSFSQFIRMLSIAVIPPTEELDVQVFKPHE
ncbi:MAG: hypothetical protein ABSD99_07235 [Candidatus Bathyarchaeia archaeon]